MVIFSFVTTVGKVAVMVVVTRFCVFLIHWFWELFIFVTLRSSGTPACSTTFCYLKRKKKKSFPWGPHQRSVCMFCTCDLSLASCSIKFWEYIYRTKVYLDRGALNHGTWGVYTALKTLSQNDLSSSAHLTSSRSVHL